jgi:hypothetical protein
LGPHLPGQFATAVSLQVHRSSSPRLIFLPVYLILPLLIYKCALCRFRNEQLKQPFGQRAGRGRVGTSHLGHITTTIKRRSSDCSMPSRQRLKRPSSGKACKSRGRREHEAATGETLRRRISLSSSLPPKVGRSARKGVPRVQVEHAEQAHVCAKQLPVFSARPTRCATR